MPRRSIRQGDVVRLPNGEERPVASLAATDDGLLYGLMRWAVDEDGDDYYYIEWVHERSCTYVRSDG